MGHVDDVQEQQPVLTAPAVDCSRASKDASPDISMATEDLERAHELVRSWTSQASTNKQNDETMDPIEPKDTGQQLSADSESAASTVIVRSDDDTPSSIGRSVFDRGATVVPRTDEPNAIMEDYEEIWRRTRHLCDQVSAGRTLSSRMDTSCHDRTGTQAMDSVNGIGSLDGHGFSREVLHRALDVADQRCRKAQNSFTAGEIHHRQDLHPCTDDTISSRAKEVRSTSGTGVEQVLATTEGMTCVGCERILEKALNSIVEVTDIEIMLVSKLVSFSVHEPVDASAVIARIQASTGYRLRRLHRNFPSIDLNLPSDKARQISGAPPDGVTEIETMSGYLAGIL